MDNVNTSSKKKVGGILLDILTIGLLFASFAALFYSGFILKSSTFPIGAMCGITAVGLLLLFFIGDVSCLVSKVKNNSLTAGFLTFSAAQLVALIVNLTLLLGLMCRLFSVDDLGARLTYAVTAVLVLIGYVASISYFSDGVAAPKEDGDADGSEDESESESEDESEGETEEAEEEAVELTEETADDSYEVGEVFDEADDAASEDDEAPAEEEDDFSLSDEESDAFKEDTL